jgi:hypothetical protein
MQPNNIGTIGAIVNLIPELPNAGTRLKHHNETEYNRKLEIKLNITKRRVILFPLTIK